MYPSQRISIARLIAAGLLLSLAIGALASPACADDQVKVSVYQSVSDAGIYIANDRGYFKAEHIDIDLIQLDAVSSVVTALAAGQVDVAGGAPSAAIYNAARQGIGIRIVADKGSLRPGHGYLGLVIRKGLEGEIRTVGDLRGRKVAWAGYGSGTTNDVALERMLQLASLGESDIQLQNLSFSDSLAALASGSVDAAYLIEPLMHSAEQRGIGSILLTGDQIDPDQQVAVLLYGAGFCGRADLAERFMRAYLRGLRDYNDAFGKDKNRAAIVDILSRNTNVRKVELYATMVLPGLDPNGALNTAGMTRDMQWFFKKGFLKQEVSMPGVIDDAYRENAVKQLGPYQ
jgi:NitT/TauT family transport system substrate-binding protein